MMPENFLSDLYRAIPKNRFFESTLKAQTLLLQGYLSLYKIVQVMPCLEKDYDSLPVIREYIIKLSKGILSYLTTEKTEINIHASSIKDVLDAAWECNDEELLQQALDNIYPLLYPNQSASLHIPVATPEMAALLCCCYYHVQENECIDSAEQIIGEWIGEKGDKNIWQNISLEEAVKKLSVINLYENVSCENDYDDTLKSGFCYCQTKLRLLVQDVNTPLHTWQEAGFAMRELISIYPYQKTFLYTEIAEAFYYACISNEIGQIPCFNILISYEKYKRLNEIMLQHEMRAI